MAFNEDTRVKIPAILHLCRLGYKYLPLANANIDESTNIFTDIFRESIARINPGIERDEINELHKKLQIVLDYEDLGKEFYNMLISSSDKQLIDFSDFNNNSFHVVTELTYKNGDDEFRPDITLLINGMPLAFIEVKKPNNRAGILAERDRINMRFQNSKFRRFINISQVLVFSNNMDYDTESIVPIQGAFYSTTSYKQANFHCFREEEEDVFLKLNPEDETTENLVLKDTNHHALKDTPEFITNKNPKSPTNKIITSLFSRERFAMILKYSLAYLKNQSGVLEKHIMRYPQFFASKAIRRTLDKGEKKGIIWHTQGSGKTALAYYSVRYLTDYFSEKGIVPKFYFIVDRLDLMIQATNEFTSRGLTVHSVNSRDALVSDFRKRMAIHNLSGNNEITVVNIQKFKENEDVVNANDYDINVQRVYFLDEVHRSYNPKGSFLANLFNSDRNAILIGLTGTPLIIRDRHTTDTFGKYIHKYYYNSSIADGYTLKLIREGIETKYKMQLEAALKEIEILKGHAKSETVYAHEKFVEPMLEYIIDDFTKSRVRFGDKSIGAMVVCSSSAQAKKLYEIFERKYALNLDGDLLDGFIKYEKAAEYNKAGNYHSLSARLILHDVENTEVRRDYIEDFKEGKVDFLFVYNMLLTGFDAHRLKKLYLNRVIRDHNLLQTLTRVNRPYKNFRYGFVVDFADIRAEFDATNKAYLEELQEDLGDEMGTYSNLFKSKEEIESEINEITEKLFDYNLVNAEIFSQQISEIQDRKTVLEIKKTLENARDLYNVIRLVGHFELLEKVDFKKLSTLYKSASDHLELLNFRDAVKNKADTANILNEALENVIFMFKKISEGELVIAESLKNILRKAREALTGNFDKKDDEYISLYEELKRLFEKRNLDEITQEEMNQNIDALTKIYDKATELNRKNSLLKAKYENDEKYARVHKRILESKSINAKESIIHDTLLSIKKEADERVLNSNRILENESYFTSLMMQMVINNFNRAAIPLEPESADFINNCVSKEYLNDYNGVNAW